MCNFHFYRIGILGLTLVLKCTFSPFSGKQGDYLLCTLHIHQRRIISYIMVLICLESKISAPGY